MEWHLFNNPYEKMKQIVKLFQYIHKNEALEARLIGALLGIITSICIVAYILW